VKSNCAPRVVVGGALSFTQALGRLPWLAPPLARALRLRPRLDILASS